MEANGHLKQTPTGTIQINVPVGILINTDAFHTGFVEGLTGVYMSDNSTRWPFSIDRTPDESDIVAIIQNLCEIAQEGWLMDEQLRHDAGLIVGLVSRSTMRKGEDRR